MKTYQNTQKKIDNELAFLSEIQDYDIFRSEICHYLQKIGDLQFLKNVLKNDWVSHFWNEKSYFKALYCVGIIDSLAYLYKTDNFPDYDFYRTKKFDSPIFPKDIEMLDKINPKEKIKDKVLKECSENEIGKIFLNFNIIERSIRNYE